MGKESRFFTRKQLVIVGAIGAPFGIKGWLKVNSYTEPKTNIWEFKDWWLDLNQEADLKKNPENLINFSCFFRLKEYKERFLVLFDKILDRSMASNLTNKNIFITRDSLPTLPEDQYYWVDLIGLNVYNLSNKFIGILIDVFYNGANDVMVIKQQNQKHLIPYSLGNTVKKVDVKNKLIIVNWDLT